MLEVTYDRFHAFLRRTHCAHRDFGTVLIYPCYPWFLRIIRLSSLARAEDSSASLIRLRPVFRNPPILKLRLALGKLNADVKRICANFPIFVAIEKIKRSLSIILTNGQRFCRPQNFARTPVRCCSSRCDSFRDLGETNQSRSIKLFGWRFQTVIPLSASACRAACIASHSSTVINASRAWLPLYDPTIPALAMASTNRLARL